MTSEDAERSPLSARRDRLKAAGDNLARLGRLMSHRRRDMRFRVVPYDGLQLVNAAVVLATLLASLVFVLDPLLVPWQSKLSENVVTFFRWVTRFGKSDWILISTGLALVVMAVIDAAALSRRLRARRAVHALAAGYVFAAVAGAGIFTNVAKYVFGRARPRHFSDAGSFAFDFFSGDASWASFPSGHATTGMALGMALGLLFPRLRWVFLTFGFWIAASRLFTRQHYPSDVVAGALVGIVFAWLLARLLARRRLLFAFDRNGRLTRRNGASGSLR